MAFAGERMTISVMVDALLRQLVAEGNDPGEVYTGVQGAAVAHLERHMGRTSWLAVMHRYHTVELPALLRRELPSLDPRCNKCGADAPAFDEGTEITLLRDVIKEARRLDDRASAYTLVSSRLVRYLERRDGTCLDCSDALDVRPRVWCACCARAKGGPGG
jgi:hypothetical protein